MWGLRLLLKFGKKATKSSKMSFINPSDMVDEDAADLQFPKGKNLLSIVFRLDQILVARQLNNFEINRNLS